MLYKLNIQKNLLILVRLVSTKDNRFKELTIKSLEVPFDFTIKTLTTASESEKMVNIFNDLFKPYLSDISGLYVSIDSNFFQIEKTNFIEPYLQKDKNYMDREISVFLTDSPEDYIYGCYVDKDNNNTILLILRKEIKNHLDRIFRALNGKIHIKNYGLDHKTSATSSKFIKTKHTITPAAKETVVAAPEAETPVKPLIKNILKEEQEIRLSRKQRSHPGKFRFTIYAALAILTATLIFYLAPDDWSRKGEEITSKKNISAQQAEPDSAISPDTLTTLADSIKAANLAATEAAEQKFNVYDFIQNYAMQQVDLLIVDHNQITIACRTAREADSLAAALPEKTAVGAVKKGGSANNIISFTIEEDIADQGEVSTTSLIFKVFAAKHRDKYPYLTFTTPDSLRKFLQQMQEQKIIFNKLKLTERNNKLFMTVDFD